MLLQSAKYIVNYPLSFFSKGNIVMFHMGRSGSTVLGDMLNQSKDILWDGEFFNKLISNSFRELNIFHKPIKKLKYRTHRSGLKFYGCEVKILGYPHLDNTDISLENFIGKIQEMHFNYYIILRRKNILRQLVSNAVALQDGYWHTKKSKGQATKIHLDLKILTNNKHDDFKAYFQHVEKRFLELDNLLINESVLKLTYEDDILKDPFIAYEKIKDYLGNIRREEITINYKRTNPLPLSESIMNFSDIEEKLKNSKYQWMLYE